MPDYSKGRIYKIVSPCGMTYYGSTTMRLWDRMGVHHRDIKKGKNCSSKRVIEAGGEIYLIEMYPCNSKKELEDRESWYIRYRPCVNEIIPNRTKQEYCQDTKPHKKEYDKQYRERTGDYQKNRRRQYYENNKHKNFPCECGSTVRRNVKARHFKTQKHMIWVENNQN